MNWAHLLTVSQIDSPPVHTHRHIYTRYPEDTWGGKGHVLLHSVGQQTSTEGLLNAAGPVLGPEASERGKRAVLSSSSTQSYDPHVLSIWLLSLNNSVRFVDVVRRDHDLFLFQLLCCVPLYGYDTIC